MANQSFSDKLEDLMRGRNGADELGIVVLGMALVLLLVSLLAHAWWLAAIALLPLAYVCWRLSSTNISARESENRAFLSALVDTGAWLRNPPEAIHEMRTYRHLSCPSCHQRVRVPRGKGRIRVTCPTCGDKFDAES